MGNLFLRFRSGLSPAAACAHPAFYERTLGAVGCAGGRSVVVGNHASAFGSVAFYKYLFRCSVCLCHDLINFLVTIRYLYCTFHPRRGRGNPVVFVFSRPGKRRPNSFSIHRGNLFPKKHLPGRISVADVRQKTIKTLSFNQSCQKNLYGAGTLRPLPEQSSCSGFPSHEKSLGYVSRRSACC